MMRLNAFAVLQLMINSNWADGFAQYQRLLVINQKSCIYTALIGAGCYRGTRTNLAEGVFMHKLVAVLPILVITGCAFITGPKTQPVPCWIGLGLQGAAGCANPGTRGMTV